jgi:23S rRNA (adenine2503-C2)-methyltransferase
MKGAGEGSLFDRLPEEIAEELSAEPAFRSRQIFKWIHSRDLRSFDAMSNLPKSLRDRLERDYHLEETVIDHIDRSPDGTVKLRLLLADGEMIEAVLLTDAGGRVTACLSTQVGCAMGCRFCRTASMGFRRNLDAREILEQLYHLESLPEVSGRIDSVVFMGMGEPLRNFDELSRAITILTHPEGRNMSQRRFTVSTSGVIDGIAELAARHPQVRLAVSLVSADSEIRAALMPVERTNSLPRLKAALRAYQQAGGRRITLEYVLLKGINHRPEDPDLIRDFAAGLSCNINLIPWNPAAGMAPIHLPDGKTALPDEPDAKTIEEFSRALEKRGLTVVLRYRKGRGVNAACGQLATEKRGL